MKVRLVPRGIDGLAARLAADILAPSAARLAARAADELAQELAAATGAAPDRAGSSEYPLLRVSDPAVLERVRGDAGRAGDPVLDRVRLALQRRGRPARRAGEARE